MSLTTIRAEIKTELESISNIGHVQDYRRHHIDWDKIISSFVEDNKVNAWIIEWAESKGEKETGLTHSLNRYHTFRLWGLYSLKDSVASAKTFEGIVEEVMNQFDTNQYLGSLTAVHFEDPARLVAIEEVFFSEIFCHRAEVLIYPFELITF